MMKKLVIILMLSLLGFITNGQAALDYCIENFDHVTTTINGNEPVLMVNGTSCVNSFTQGPSTAPTNNFTNARSISGNGVVLRTNNGERGYVEIPLVNGVKGLKFYCTRSYSTNANIKITISNASQTIVKQKMNIDDSIRIWSNQNLNIPDSVMVRIELEPGGSCTIDSMVWDNVIQVDVSQPPLWSISDYLVGMHSVYNIEADSVLDSANYNLWLKDAGINTLRFPGGTIVKEWDWENPTGVVTNAQNPIGDRWDPAYDNSNDVPGKYWRSLDEYITTLNVSGMTGLFGVNITSGHLHDSLQASIDRAVRMVEYVDSLG